MINYTIEHRSVENLVLINVSKNGQTIEIFSGHPKVESINKIAEIGIEILWDMLRDNLAGIDISAIDNPALFRRKGEAIEAISYILKVNRS